MTQTAASSSVTTQAAALLAARQAELRTLLQTAARTAVGAADESHDVQDFKDVAAGETQAQLEDVTTAHATQELTAIAEALRRIEDGSYGQCLDCGERIDERRLLAMPASTLCTACQSIHERPAGRR